MCIFCVPYISFYLDCVFQCVYILRIDIVKAKLFLDIISIHASKFWTNVQPVIFIVCDFTCATNLWCCPFIVLAAFKHAKSCNDQRFGLIFWAASHVFSRLSLLRSSTICAVLVFRVLTPLTILWQSCNSRCLYPTSTFSVMVLAHCFRVIAFIALKSSGRSYVLRVSFISLPHPIFKLSSS